MNIFCPNCASVYFKLFIDHAMCKKCGDKIAFSDLSNILESMTPEKIDAAFKDYEEKHKDIFD